MITFQEFLSVDITEEELDSIVEELQWEDIADLWEDSEFVEEIEEAISATARMKKSQKFKSRKTAVGQSRRLKLKRAASTDVINRRSKVAARQAIIRKLLKGRQKHQLSAAEKDRIEKQASNILSGQKGLVARMVPKVRSLERSRLAGKKK
jgi:uncharacterized protein (DUF4213/DUF364 family)